MLRRQTRERREYIYKKALESKEKQIYDRKQAIREALASGKPLPAELRGKDATDLGRDLNLDAAQDAPGTSIDDEYSRAGTYDPRVLVTTSRDPSTRLTQFAKEVRLLFPNSTRLNRGSYTVADLAAAARANGITDMVVLHEHRGVPDAMVVSHFPHGPTLLFTLHNVAQRQAYNWKEKRADCVKREVQASLSSAPDDADVAICCRGENSAYTNRGDTVKKPDVFGGLRWADLETTSSPTPRGTRSADCKYFPGRNLSDSLLIERLKHMPPLKEVAYDFRVFPIDAIHAASNDTKLCVGRWRVCDEAKR
ncbi:hypothetical protein L1887_42038 [Cichorium endivia]|nr:hypothetical protein L1887_42038 [Cichorium endivia]